MRNGRSVHRASLTYILIFHNDLHESFALAVHEESGLVRRRIAWKVKHARYPLEPWQKLHNA